MAGSVTHLSLPSEFTNFCLFSLPNQALRAADGGRRGAYESLRLQDKSIHHPLLPFRPISSNQWPPCLVLEASDSKGPGLIPASPAPPLTVTPENLGGSPIPREGTGKSLQKGTERDKGVVLSHCPTPGAWPTRTSGPQEETTFLQESDKRLGSHVSTHP